MPAVPPAGNGLKIDVDRSAAWLLMLVCPCAWKVSDEEATGRSVVFQLRLVLKTASNLDNDRSMLAPVTAGSMAKTRMASVKLARPLNVTSVSLYVSTPGDVLTKFWLPTVPCSRAMEIASASDI